MTFDSLDYWRNSKCQGTFEALNECEVSQKPQAYSSLQLEAFSKSIPLLNSQPERQRGPAEYRQTVRICGFGVNGPVFPTYLSIFKSHNSSDSILTHHPRPKFAQKITAMARYLRYVEHDSWWLRTEIRIRILRIET
jgi:hypothetical protein